MTYSVSVTRRDGVALIVVDNPPVNAIGLDVRKGLIAAIDEISKVSGVVAAVVTAAGKTFMAGADIREFDAPPVEPLIAEVAQVIENAQVPVVAAIHGTALGGGFETAMGCHYRVAAKDAKVGLPEINLGIVPGGSGTQRLPRLIGAEKALDWILSGRHVDASEALKAGAIDEIAEGDLLEAAIAAAKRLAASKTIRRTSALSVPNTPPDFFTQQRNVVAAKTKNQDAPIAAVAAVEAAATKPFAEGLAVEREISLRLKSSDQSRALRHLFFGEREVARVPDIPKDTPLRAVSTVGVIGAGTMGRGITAACLTAGLKVRWVDRTQEFLDKGRDAVAQIYHRDVEKKRITESVMAERMARLSLSPDMASLGDADLVIEAAFENMAVKQDLFRQLDKVCKPGAILASNTSTLNVDEIAAVTGRPQDVMGLHFFSPAHIMRLLEVVRGAKSAPEVVATSMNFGKRIGKVAVLSGVCFGFIGNRMFESYVRESQMLLLEGASPAQVDRALTDYGMAMGPCAVIDLAGVDVSYLTREGNRANLPPDPRYCAIGDKLNHMGRFGQKTAKGFYRYVNGKPEDDPDVAEIIKAEAARLNVKPRNHTPDEIVARCLYPSIDEGARILSEGIALRSVDIDVVWTSGYGFPRYRGGPMFYADLIGAGKIAAQLEKFAAELGNEFGYWTPSPLLVKLAREGKTFKDWSAA